jgi:hypothetical protein
MATTTAFHEILATVRQTAAANASALDELERAFSAQTVRNKPAEEKCVLIISINIFFFLTPLFSSSSSSLMLLHQ